MEKLFKSESPKDTLALGEKIGKLLKKGSVLALCGSLGSGKTMLTKGIARALKVKKSSCVNSPSFVILKEYEGKLPLYHFDVYRLLGIDSFSTVPYGEYFYGRGVSVIEWADKVIEALPKDYLSVIIDIAGESERTFKIKSFGKKYETLLRRL